MVINTVVDGLLSSQTSMLNDACRENRGSSPTRQVTDTHFFDRIEDSSPTHLKTVHRGQISLCSSISSKISILRQLSKYVSTDVQKKFYQGYILPLIDYGSIVWGTASSSNLDRISKLQKRSKRIILHADFKAPSALMFKELRWYRTHVRR